MKRTVSDQSKTTNATASESANGQSSAAKTVMQLKKSKHTVDPPPSANALLSSFVSIGRNDHPLVEYARKGDVAMVEALLDAGAPLEVCGKWTENEDRGFYAKSWDWKMDTALVAACRNGHSNVVQLLLTKGANVHHNSCIQCDVYDTPLSVAKTGYHLECVRLIELALQDEKRIEFNRKLDYVATHWESFSEKGKVPSLFEIASNSILSKANEDDERKNAENVARELSWVLPPGLLACDSGEGEEEGLDLDVNEKSCMSVQALQASVGDVFFAQMKAAKDNYSDRKRFDESLGFYSSYFADIGDGHNEGSYVETNLVLAQEWYVKGLNTLMRSDFEEYKIACGEDLMRKIATLGQVLGRSKEVTSLQQAWERKRGEVKVKADERRKEYARQEALRLQEINQKLARQAAIRLAEVNRCKAVGPARTRGICTDNRCRYPEDFDGCTYFHRHHDLPPRCQFFVAGNCFNGDSCPFNHLKYS